MAFGNSTGFSTGATSQNTNAGVVVDTTVAATTTPQRVGDLFTLPAPFSQNSILEVWIAAKATDGTTDRVALLWGSSTPTTPLAAGVSERIPLRGANWYVRTVSGSSTIVLTALIA